MPNYLNAIAANQFWTAPESDIFPLPVVAIALGIGRNKMCKIPVKRIMVERRAFYRKSDILNWALAEQARGKDSLLLKLRAENSSIGRAERNRSKFYDYYFSKSNRSHYRPNSVKGETKKDTYYRLRKEWRNSGGIYSQLENCNDNEELKILTSVAWGYRREFIRLREGLPDGIELKRWWFIIDFDKLMEARKNSKKQMVQSQIDYYQNQLDTNDFSNFYNFYDPNFEENEHKLDINKLIAELRTELEELG